MISNPQSPIRTPQSPPWIAAIAITFTISAPASAQWLQWGGPQRDFTVDAKGLADKWPDAGPKQLWRRDLGDGYSTILVDDGVLYTMYRIGNDEFTIALRAADGKTIWQHKNPSPFTKTMAEYGPGPHATPLIVDNRLYSVGANGVLHCFEKKDGKMLWKHDLINEFNGELRARGYSCSPIAYKNTVILPLGSEKDGPAALAFDQITGKVAWKSAGGLHATYAAPLLIRFDGEDQLVLFMASELVAMNPTTGRQLWSAEHRNNASVNASTPVWNGKDILFCSNAYDGGARAFRLMRKDGKTAPKELWYNTKMKLHHGNALRIGDNIYASSGSGAAFYMGLKLATGEMLFRERGFSKATALYADGKLILLDEDGQLALATLADNTLKVLSKCTLAEPYAWAAPTLAGTTLYLRDRKHLWALNLGK